MFSVKCKEDTSRQYEDALLQVKDNEFRKLNIHSENGNENSIYFFL